jgi:hypothetical protein
MPKIQPIATEQKFEDALLDRPTGKGKPKKTALGKNLYLVTSLKTAPDSETDLHHAFQLRIFGNGQDRTRTIGHYPIMTYAMAREKADKEWIEQKKAREEGREAERARLYENIRAGKMPTAPMPCFGSIENAAIFIERLKVAIDSRILVLLGNTTSNRLFPIPLILPIQNEEISNTRLQAEIYLAIWLMLLIPARANALIDQLYDDPLFGNKAFFYFQLLSKKNQLENLTSSDYLSKNVRRAIRALQELKNATAISSASTDSKPPALHSDVQTDPLFPNLIKIKGNDRREKIAEAIKEIWRTPPIQTNRFKAFFEEIAIRHSEFEMKFIKEYIANKRPYNFGSKDSFQLAALAEWWGWQLDTAQDIFKIHTFESPQALPAQGESPYSSIPQAPQLPPPQRENPDVPFSRWSEKQ